MTFDNRWYDEEKTIIFGHFEPGWTWEQCKKNRA